MSLWTDAMMTEDRNEMLGGGESHDGGWKIFSKTTHTARVARYETDTDDDDVRYQIPPGQRYTKTVGLNPDCEFFVEIRRAHVPPAARAPHPEMPGFLHRVAPAQA